MLRFATLYRTCGMNHVNVRQNRSHLSITSLKIQTRYFISPLANMHIKKHQENHTQPSGEAKLERWLLNTSTLDAPTTPLEGKKAICVHWKAKALSPTPFSHFTFPPGCCSISEAGWTRPLQGDRAKPDSLQARSPTPAHRLAQPRAFPESNTRESTGAFCQRSHCASPGDSLLWNLSFPS